MQRLVFESFMELVICAIIGMYNKSSLTHSDSFARVSAFFSLLAVFVLMAFGFYFALIKSEKLVSENRKYNKQQRLKYSRD